MLFLCFFSACSHKPVRTSAPPSAPPLASPSAPSAAHQTPARDAQAQLLQEAHRAFKEERYTAAALFYQRFTDIAQDSPRLAEAHWWLGRCQERLGDFAAAMAQYRLVASGSLVRQADGARYESHALRRLDELYGLRAAQQSRTVAQLAIRLRADQLPPMTQLPAWFHDMAQAGVAAVVVVPAVQGREGFGVELVRAVAAEAHRLGMLLWVALDVHQGAGMEIRPEWRTTTVDDSDHVDGVTAMIDIAHPAYQSYLEGMIRMLARTGLDGLLLTARARTGFADEFSGWSLREFAASLGRDVSPGELWRLESMSEAKTANRSAEYWRWVGWKARSYGQLVKRLRQVLRDHRHTATLAVEVHQASLTNPLEGLTEFGEDVAELVGQIGGAVVVRREGPDGEAVLQKLGRQAGAPERVWVGVRVKSGSSLPSMADVNQSIRERAEYARWNVLVEIESAQALP